MDLQQAARRIQFHHDKAVEGWRNAILHGWNCGKILNRVKRDLGHGRFLQWLRRNFKWSERTAQNYMKLARTYKEPPTDTAHLTLRDALGAMKKGGSGTGGGRNKGPLARNGTLWAETVGRVIGYLFRGWTNEELMEAKVHLDQFYGPPTVEATSILLKAMEKLRRLMQQKMANHGGRLDPRGRLYGWRGRAQQRRRVYYRPLFTDDELRLKKPEE